MSTLEEVIRIGKKLEKLISDDASDHGSAADLLKVLKSLPITLEVLKKTHIGVTVNNFRKVCRNEDAVSVSKSVIKAWKKLVPESGSGEHSERRHGEHSDRRHGDHTHHHHDGDRRHSDDKKSASRCSSTGGASSRSLSNTSVSSVHSDSNDEPVRSSSDSCSAAVPDRRESGESNHSSSSSLKRRDSTQSSDSFKRTDSMEDAGKMSADESIDPPLSPTAQLPNVEVDETRDPTRIKCRDMLAAALRAPPAVEGGGDPEILAAEIEHFVFKLFEDTGMKYVNRVRSRITNLKDVKNPRLRENVLLGHISPKMFAMMSPEEMASEEMRKMREKLAQEAFNDHQMSQQGGTQSDLFKCGRCGKRNTTYTQLQTRSSDEPMTTFVLCNECGYRWKCGTRYRCVNKASNRGGVYRIIEANY